MSKSDTSKLPASRFRDRHGFDRYAKILNRDCTRSGKFTGGSRRCPPDVCHSHALGIRWDDGKLSFVCARQIEKINGDAKNLRLCYGAA